MDEDSGRGDLRTTDVAVIGMGAMGAALATACAAASLEVTV